MRDDSKKRENSACSGEEMCDIIKRFFPKTYELIPCDETETEYTFELVPVSESAKCPNCTREKFGKTVLLRVLPKKYYCDNKNCRVELFIARTGFIDHYSQFTVRCREYMLKVAVYVICEASHFLILV